MGARWRWALACAWVVVSGGQAAAETYSYDSLGRLVVVVSDNGTKTVYAYDAAGNRTTVATTAGSSNAPTAVDDTLFYNYGSPPLTYDPRVNDTDPAGQALSIVGVSPPTFGTVAFNAGSVTYTPPITTSRVVQTDTFSYTIQNSSGLTASAVIHVNLGYAQPIANPDSMTVANTASGTIDPRGNDSDPAGNPLSVTAVGAPSHGSSSFTPTSVTYTPSAGYSGGDSFSYAIGNGVGGSASSTVSVSVTGAPLSASGTDWAWYQHNNDSPSISPASASVCTASGGIGPYTYHWEYVSGDSAIYPGSPNGASTAWGGRESAGYGYWSAQWHCKVTDSASHTAYSNEISVSFEHDNDN